MNVLFSNSEAMRFWNSFSNSVWRGKPIMQACSANQHQVIMPSWLPKVPSWLRKNALCLSQSAFSNFALHVIKRIKLFLFLPELSRSLWENLDLGRLYRPHCVRSVLTISVKILPYRPPARSIRANYFRNNLSSETGKSRVKIVARFKIGLNLTIKFATCGHHRKFTNT